MLANLQIGAVTVLLSPRYPAATFSEMTLTAGCSHQVVFSGESRRSTLGKAAKIPLPSVAEILSEVDAGTAGLATDHEGSLAADQPATIVFTSGSSGPPKAVLHSYGNHYYSALGSNQNLPVEPGDRWLLSLPLYHVGGLGVIFRCCLGGGTIVFQDDQSALTEQIARERITHLSLVPTQFRRLLVDPDLVKMRSSLKVILLGGGPIPTALLKRAVGAGLPVVSSYGLTEMTSQVATGSLDLPDRPHVLHFREVRIADDGEICVRGDTLFSGYVEGAVVRRSCDSDGWFHTGDIGAIDAAGCLSVSGRKDNMFISGGENIHPEQIEKTLCSIEGIEDALVVPVHDPEYGYRPVAFVRYRPDINLSEAQSDLPEEARFAFDHQSLSSELARTLPRYMLPLAYHPWPQGYKQTGIKSDRAFFMRLAEKLHPIRR